MYPRCAPCPNLQCCHLANLHVRRIPNHSTNYKDLKDIITFSTASLFVGLYYYVRTPAGGGGLLHSLFHLYCIQYSSKPPVPGRPPSARFVSIRPHMHRVAYNGIYNGPLLPGLLGNGGLKQHCCCRLACQPYHSLISGPTHWADLADSRTRLLMRS